MKKLKTTYSILIFLMINTGIFAQTGPVSPCVDCEQFTTKTEPFNGTWYNPDQSGTGFSIDVQNGILFGTYYGYDEQGKAIWLTFVGDLVPSDEPNVMWTVDTDLLQFENGNAFNQDYTAPMATNYQGQIHLKFTQKNHALFSVNNGEEQNIVPIIFGMPASANFPEQTSYRFPELEGVWTLTYHFKSATSTTEVPFVPPEPFSIISQTIVIPKKTIADSDGDGIDDVIYGLHTFDAYPDFHIIGRISCGIKPINDDLSGPSCELIDDRGLFGDIENKPRYKLSIGGLGAFRIFGEHEDGHTFEAIKINSKNYAFFE
ncbi:MAG: hypothetical protein L3J83_06615 [Proteobacteria bacterium]|nr:hypothetical protein [Pseudomonadota bacterium]